MSPNAFYNLNTWIVMLLSYRLQWQLTWDFFFYLISPENSLKTTAVNKTGGSAATEKKPITTIAVRYQSPLADTPRQLVRERNAKFYWTYIVDLDETKNSAVHNIIITATGRLELSTRCRSYDWLGRTQSRRCSDGSSLSLIIVCKNSIWETSRAKISYRLPSSKFSTIWYYDTIYFFKTLWLNLILFLLFLFYGIKLFILCNIGALKVWFIIIWLVVGT